MNVLKGVASVPRQLSRTGIQSLTVWGLLLAMVAAIMLWLGLDLFYQRDVHQLVTDNWQQRLEQEAREQHSRLGHAVQAFADTAHYLVNHPPLLAKMQQWNREDHTAFSPEISHWQPDWLSTLKSVDSRISIDYALALDSNRQLRGVYANQSIPLPTALKQMDVAALSLLPGKAHLLGGPGEAFLASLVSLGNEQGSIIIMAQINSKFLSGILGAFVPGYMQSALYFESSEQLLAVTGQNLQAAGYTVSDATILTSAGGPELRHVVRNDPEQIGIMGEQFLFSVREQRTLALIVFAALFSVTLVWFGGRINRVHHLLEVYARRLGFHMPAGHEGDSISRLENRVERLSEEMIAETTALEYQARHDSLTNLPNRAMLLEQLEIELQTSRENNETLSLFIMDLDQFKEVNDTLGHHVGDRLLQEVGRRLVSVFRRTDTVARLGGDEFAVLLPGADEQRSQAVCRKIIAAMDKPIKVENLRLRANISIGVALCPDHGQDANLLLRYADVAMYEAKRKHKGFAFYTSDTDEHSISRLGLSGELRDAIEDNQLTLDYQPMVDVKSGRIFCAEALVRWNHPEYGLISPEEFIPTAEQTGVIRPLTLWVIDKALEQSAVWALKGIRIRISVNLSVRSLQDRRLPGQVEKLMEKHHVDPKQVILEITESAIMSDPLSARRVMRRLANMGFHLSIDDFGTGYSSLAYLKQLPVDEIKIDKSFVTRMDQDENDAVIVRATIDLAHNLGLKVVAEGVENTDVWDLLEMLGCDIIQGYFIRKPMAAVELTDWIQSGSWEQAHWVTPMKMAK